MTNTDLNTRINTALAAERAAASAGSVWSDSRRILENLAEMENPAEALVNESSYEGYGDACAFPEGELEGVQAVLGLGDENPFITADEWLTTYEAKQ